MSYGPWAAYEVPARREEPSDLERELRHLDWTLLGAVVGLSLLGALLVWSATNYKMEFRGLDPHSFLKKQLLNVVVGFLLGAVVSRLDYRMLRAYAPFLYLLSLGGLALVLFVGSEVNGAKAWITLPGGFSVQPSEFSKLALVLAMAMLLSERRDGEDRPRSTDVVQVLLLAGVPMGLVLLQDDLGSVMVLGAIMFGMIAMSGAPGGWVGGLFAVAVVGAITTVASGALDDYQMKRLISFVDPSADPDGAGYNTQQSRITIGSGGLFGRGLFQGPQTQGAFVPEQHTDFVFTVAGEELGFVGAGGILLLLAILLWRALQIGLNAPDLFGRMVAGGVVCWFTFQAFENIGMYLGIMPVTGLPLPFVSYGGSAMFANLMAVGLLQNVHIRRYI